VRRAAATMLCSMLVAAGCGATHRKASATASKLVQAEATHEYPSPAPPRQTSSQTAPTAIQAIHEFAAAYINWTAQTVAADMRSLAAQSIGQARSAMALAAAETAGDYELMRGGIANDGTVEAVSPLPGHENQYRPGTSRWPR